MAKLTISLAQMQIIYGDVTRNLNTFKRMTEEAARRKSNMVIFPELWSTGYDLSNAKTHADELNKGIFTEISKTAAEYKTAVLGSVLEKRGLGVANSAVFFAPNGRSLGVYRKLHLFGLMEEDQWLEAGSSPLTMSLPWGITGVAICYDLRFPELFRRYTTQEHARLILIPAEWPLVRIDHWRTLLIARAIENQCYIIGCNAAGESGDTVFGGHSMIVDPWGKIVVEAGEDPQLITAEIELDTIDAVRKTIPVFDDMRLDIYG